ncbi:DUF2330 domain-containing protein [Candidatus Bathyarchaeota archaeon]|nr:DUF2330 domain-containing protein [Candidatus Bathyarchaeota archaeon]
MKVDRVFILTLFLTFALPILSPHPALGDRGVLPIDDVMIYQQGQVAAIAWRNGDEVLILSSSLQIFRYAGIEGLDDSNAPKNSAKALEILPLPSMPEIEEGDFEVFQRLSDIAELGMAKTPIYGRASQDVRQGVQIIFQETIGPHDITVVKADGAEGLISWATRYTEEKGLSPPESRWLGLLKEVAKDYITEGFTYFVFDIVNIGVEAKTVKPLIYKFQSKKLYYPLRISSLIDSYSQITLFLITEEKIKPESLENSGFRIVFEDSVGLSKIGDMGGSLLKPFQGLESIWLTVLMWKGSLGSLKADLRLEIGFSLENLKPLIAFFAPVLAALAILGLCYAKAYGRLGN